MRGIHFFLLVVTLPVLIALGHDLYLFYVAQDQGLSMDLVTKIHSEDRPARQFDFAALGFVWTKYSPDTYALMAESFEPSEWAGIQEFLKLKAVYVFGAFAVLMYIVAFLFKIGASLKNKSEKVSKRRKAKMRSGN